MKTQDVVVYHGNSQRPGFLNIHLFIPAQFQGIIDVPVSVVDRHHVVREAVAFGAGNVPVAEQWKVLAKFLIVGIIDNQNRVLFGSCRRVLAQQFQAALIDRSRRPGILGEKTVEAALVLDLNHKRAIDRSTFAVNLNIDRATRTIIGIRT